MAALYFDQRLSDDERRQALYNGDIFVYSPTAETQKLCSLGRAMIEEAFSPFDPRRVDQYLNMEDTAALLAKLKPAFIHHPECKRLLPEIITQLGGDPSKIYFDVPRMRSAILRTISPLALHMRFIRIGTLGIRHRCAR
jgi:hypothetical protein